MKIHKWSFVTAAITALGIVPNAFAQDGEESIASQEAVILTPAPEPNSAPAPKPTASDVKTLSEPEPTPVPDEKTPILKAMKIQGRVQSRLQMNKDFEGIGKKKTAAFSIPRARLTFKGQAHSTAISYKFQTDFGKGFASLKDFFVDYKFGSSTTRLRVGQFKKPFSRQQLTSSSKLSLVDRSIVDKAMKNGRDIGLELHNAIGKHDGLEWAFGVFNGTGEKGVFSGRVDRDFTSGEDMVINGTFSNVPDTFRPATVLRVGYNHGGIKGYSESDLEGGPLRYSLAIAAMFHAAGGDRDNLAHVGADFAIKSQGVAATGGIYLAEQGSTFDEIDYSSLGTYLQTGILLGEKWEPAARVAVVHEEGGTFVYEISAGLSLYEFGHAFTLQSDVSYLRTDYGESGAKRDLRARTQLQLSF